MVSFGLKGVGEMALVYHISLPSQLVYLGNYPLILSLIFVKVVHRILKVLTLSLLETVSIRGLSFLSLDTRWRYEPAAIFNFKKFSLNLYTLRCVIKPFWQMSYSLHHRAPPRQISFLGIFQYIIFSSTLPFLNRPWLYARCLQVSPRTRSPGGRL